jgi:hypothetical protein
MSQDAIGIIDAIKSIDSNKDIVASYLIPILSSLLGFFVAISTIILQEFFKVQKARINDTNEWVLIIRELFTALSVTKKLYVDKLTSDPIQRALNIPLMIKDLNKIDKNITTIIFIAKKKKTKNKDSVLISKSMEITRIQAMKNNYNMLVEMWHERNVVARRVIDQILLLNNGKLDLIHKDILFKINDFIPFIDLSERTIVLTDSIIIEMYDFLNGITKISHKHIYKLSKILYGGLLEYNMTGVESISDIIKRTIIADYTLLSEIIGISAEELKKSYMSGYK